MRSIKKYTDCFSGHRLLPVEKLNAIEKMLKEKIIELTNNGYLYFGTGGALGFDTIAALTVLKLKTQYPTIRLILVLPCLSQADMWSYKNKAIYDSIKNKADKIVYTSVDYTNNCMQKRNRHFVNNSSICICYLTKNNGGTAYTVNYAYSQGIDVFNIAE